MRKTEIVTTYRCFKKVKKGIEKLSIHPYLMFIRSCYRRYVVNHLRAVSREDKLVTH